MTVNSVQILQISGLAVLGGGSMLAGLLPVCLQTKTAKLSSGPVLSCLACYGGGVILATCFTHMMPEVQNFLSTNFEKGQLSPSLKSFPLAEVFVLIGFYLIYIIEEVTHALIDRCAAGGQPGHNQGHDEMQILNQAGVVSHKNGSDQQPAFVSAMRGFLVVLALSLHEMFEGIALGLATTEKGVWLLLLAIGSHKFIISLCIGQQLVTNKVNRWLIAVYIATFSLTTIIGAAAGMAMTSHSDDDAKTVGITLMQGIATGSLLYVVFFEVIEKERAGSTSHSLQLVFIILGSVTIISLKVLEDTLSIEDTSPTIEEVAVNNSSIIIKE